MVLPLPHWLASTTIDLKKLKLILKSRRRRKNELDATRYLTRSSVVSELKRDWILSTSGKALVPPRGEERLFVIGGEPQPTASCMTSPFSSASQSSQQQQQYQQHPRQHRQQQPQQQLFDRHRHQQDQSAFPGITLAGTSTVVRNSQGYWKTHLVFFLTKGVAF